MATGRWMIDGRQAPKAHLGLRLDRFMDIDDTDWKDVATRRLDDAVYRLAYARWERLWAERGAGRIMVKGRVRSRLAAGLGAKGVLEVGLRLSHVYGTPVIPGSSIKGVLRARIEDQELAEFLFGSQESEGFTAFEDAWWIPDTQSPLSLDVITVHHPDYYTRNAAPTDFDNPNPVHFLSVRGMFLFVGRFVGEDPEGRWTRYVERFLRDTLEKRGIGGKTVAGYGRFSFVEPGTRS